MAEDSEGESWVCGALVPVPGDSDQQQRHLCDQGSHGWPKGEPHIAGTAAGGSYGCCPRGVSASPLPLFLLVFVQFVASVLS